MALNVAAGEGSLGEWKGKAVIDEPAVLTIGWPIGRIDEHRHAVGEIEPATDHESDTSRPRGLMRPHDPCERIAVNGAERFDSHRSGLGKQLLATARPRRNEKWLVT